ncbi:hypothetical protein [Nocardia huaxiensis]|uniref:hypothetical protein n=1 Tax=Nocardia huaxiensis TaxID=2755382 RepID=UPI001E37AADD|nr:hypothetical protein [Nocardia huaxiensis]UFS97324.1 hypothetical protein LPY97_05240 [Nocardia huaxiensis]
MPSIATAVRIIVTVAVIGALAVWSFLDLDTAAKVAGVVACLLALPAIWLLGGGTRQARQSLRRVKTKGAIRQHSSRPANQRIAGAYSDKDIDQRQ